jgi:hypothetical protein
VKKGLIWGVCLLALGVAGLLAFDELGWRFAIVERGQPSTYGVLVMQPVNGKGGFCSVFYEEHPSYPMHRRLEITCGFGSKDSIQYREDTSDRYLGAIRLFDGAEHLITTWAGGSAYRVRVYRLGPDAITKAMEAGSIGAPGMHYDRDGRLVIETTDYGPVGGRANPVSVMHVWDEATGRFREQR